MLTFIAYIGLKKQDESVIASQTFVHVTCCVMYSVTCCDVLTAVCKKAPPTLLCVSV